MVESATGPHYVIDHASLTDVGLRRANNQDSHTVVLAGGEDELRSRGHMFLVADGMGGHAAGELASKLACNGITHIYRKLVDRSPVDALRQAFRETNESIFSRGQANAEFQGMGTTSCVLLLLPEGALTAHVGDSRIYRLRDNVLEQLTFDHSVVWEMKAAGHLAGGEVPAFVPRNQITRSLGPHSEVQADLEGFFALEAGDTFLLCSDGLSGQVKDEEIGVVLAALPPDEAVQTLVHLANLRGGPDNITVVVVKVVRWPAASAGSTSGPLAKAPGLAGVSTLLWVVFGICVPVAAVMALLSKTLPAVLSGLGALVAAAAGAWQAMSRPPQPEARDPGRPLGKGPHTTRRCVADQASVAVLAGLVEQLRDTASRQPWQIDWARASALTEAAHAAAGRKAFLEAAAGYARAITFLMGEIRSQAARQTAGQQAVGG